MASWYVRKGGSDSNGGSSSGTSPDRSGSDMSTTNGSTQVTSASAAFSAGDAGKGINIAGTLYRIATYTNSTTIQLERTYAGTTGSSRAWAIGGALLTIGKLLATSAAIMQNGDTLWIGAGTYRETVTPTMTALTATGYVKGDIDGVATGDAGAVIWTSHTTNDTTAAATTACLTTNGRHYLAFSNICFIGGRASPSCVNGATATHDISFTNCSFNIAYQQQSHIKITSAAGTALTWTIDRCSFSGGAYTSGQAALWIVLTRHSADYNAAVTVSNCQFVVGLGANVRVESTGAGAGYGGGVAISNCFLGFCNTAVAINDTTLSATYPCTVTNSIVYGYTGLYAAAASICTEDYNWISAVTARTNISAGAHSTSSGAYAPLLGYNSELVWGGRVRAFTVPTASSPMLGFGNSSGPSVDLANNPRPAGGASASNAIGAFERGQSFAKETGTVRTGSNAISITGPGYHDIVLPVDAVSTTVTCYVRWDATYAGTKPKLQVRGGTECGVADADATATGSSGAWEQLSLNFTPTASGIVTIRLLSSDTNGGGKMFADDLAGA